MPERWNIAAGELNRRVTIEVKTAATVDGRGHPERTWASYLVDVAAKIETTGGRKEDVSHQLTASATHVITMRYRELDVHTHRINYKGRIFNIAAQENVDERNVKLILSCTEQKAQG